MIYRTFIIAVLITVSITSCKNPDKALSKSSGTINAVDLEKYISVLASDDFEGRAPSTEGEKKTINYLAEEFGKLGLEPANKGSWLQEVSMTKITPGKNMQMNITGGKDKLSFNAPGEIIGGSPQTDNTIDISNSEMVFAGYGIIAPEYNWNDYKGLDVKGKTVVVLVNDPGYATGDTSLFAGKAMTYYGRWTYKFEEAARQGAKAVLIIHETGAAAYPWEVVQNSWVSPHFYLDDNEFLGTSLLFTGWITSEAAKKLFSAAGLDFGQIINNAAQRGFSPVTMPLKASLSFSQTVEHVRSNNVAALLRGSDKSDEYVIYSAHWDHFGINPEFKGDSVLNGALDNATGVAALLEIAKAFKSLPEKQSRSVLFLAVTAEEQGLLGSKYYVENPIFPLEKTIADINMDALNIFGRTRDITIVGFGNSKLDNYAEEVLKNHERYASPDPTPEKGGYFRSDHFEFARKGVPALYFSKGVDNIEHGREWALAESEKWISENYHKPSDNYEPDKWDFNGMIDDIVIFFETGYELSMTGDFPEWNTGFPFKSLRDNMMKKN